jgi:hypothetical protein
LFNSFIIGTRDQSWGVVKNREAYTLYNFLELCLVR